MAIAAESSVLGDFGGAKMIHADRTIRFERHDDDFVVIVRDSSGSTETMRVLHTFGVHPLQQYLVAGERGRLQRLPFSWDARARSEGGQRWFHVYGDEPVGPGNLLHWRRRSQTWNLQCADCHSTGLRKRYGPATDTYRTSWAEIDVSCEACHGPGSRHVEWAEEGRKNGADIGLETAPSMGTCAACHAHRTPIAPPGSKGGFLDRYRPSLLRAPLYYPDGQPREETFVYGSFLQSRMHQEGVVCIDCHDAHSGDLVATGNRLCTRCHEPTVYDAKSHTFHPAGSPGERCIECHMPATVFMQIDARRDHAFRLAWPTVEGAPNACVACHEDRGEGWVVETLEGWYGQSGIGAPFGPVFQAAEKGDPRVLDDLIAIAQGGERPPIVRATALSFLDRYSDPRLVELGRVAAADSSALVRAEAFRPLARVPPGDRISILGPLLEDPVRLVRLAAARALARTGPVSESSWSPALASALAEYEASLILRADDPVALVEQGDHLLLRGNLEAAEEAYRDAIRLEDRFVPASVNLADLLRSVGRDAEGLDILRDAIARVPDEPSLHHALALLLVRTEGPQAAFPSIRSAYELDPEDPRIALAYALTLDAVGRSEDASRIVEAALGGRSFDRDLLLTAIDLDRRKGDLEHARAHARRLMESHPRDRRFAALLESLGGSDRR